MRQGHRQACFLVVMCCGARGGGGALQIACMVATDSVVNANPCQACALALPAVPCADTDGDGEASAGEAGSDETELLCCAVLCCAVLCRRERAGLDAGSDGEASPGGEGGSDEAELLRHEGLDLHHNMLEESNKVEEYEKLNRISGGWCGCGWVWVGVDVECLHVCVLSGCV